MSNDKGKINIPLMIGSLAALGCLVAYIYHDDDLRNRVKDQVNSVLDISERLVSAVSDLSAKLNPPDQQSPIQGESLEAQWAAVAEARAKA